MNSVLGNRPYQRGLFVTAVILGLFVRTAAAQGVALQVGDDILVSRGPEGKQLIEPHLAAHPSDPDHLLAVGWVYPEATDQRQPDEEYCAVFLSTDGGRTWSGHDLHSIGCADPWVTLTEGEAVLSAMGTHANLPDPDWLGQVIAFFSADGGARWHETPQSLGRGHDGPRSSAGADGMVYFTSGQSWGDGGQIPRFTIFVGRARPGIPYVATMDRLVPSNLNLNADGLAVLSDGSLVVTYTDYQRKADGGFRTRAGALERKRTWAMISDDAGESFSLPLLITEACYARPTFLAVDTSGGPYQDRLYHVCVGDGLQSILLMYSADRGEEWSAATPVEPPASQDRARRAPQVAVNRDGVVAVAWMDRRDDPSGQCYAPYVTASTDGGRTFGPAVRVADEPSCPDPEKTGGAGSRWPTGGDYFGLAADAAGRFHVLWPDARTGSFELRTARVTVGAAIDK